jgi:hypothetical protein
MSAGEGAELRDALKSLQDACSAGDARGGEAAALERALLTTAAAVINADEELVVTAVRLLQAPDDNGTTRLEVRDQAMTHRRWFEVSPNGRAQWGDR